MNTESCVYRSMYCMSHSFLKALQKICLMNPNMYMYNQLIITPSLSPTGHIIRLSLHNQALRRIKNPEQNPSKDAHLIIKPFTQSTNISLNLMSQRQIEEQVESVVKRLSLTHCLKSSQNPHMIREGLTR